MPTGGLLGTGATDLFCAGVERGSKGLVLLLRNPALMLLVLAAIVGLLVFAVVRATWLPVAPLRIARRRSWGQVLSASARMYVKRPGLFLGIGLLLLPIAFVITVLQWLCSWWWTLLGDVTGQGAGAFALLALVIGTTLTLLGLGLVQAATACALVELDAGRPIGQSAPTASRWGGSGRCSAQSRIFVAAWVILTATAVLIPVAIWLAVRWCLFAPVVELEVPRRLRRCIAAAPRPAALDSGRLARRRQRR